MGANTAPKIARAASTAAAATMRQRGTRFTIPSGYRAAKGAAGDLLAGGSACPWSFYISLVAFVGVSPAGALENSPWREPWDQVGMTRSPGRGERAISRRVIDLRARSAFLRPCRAGRFRTDSTGLPPWAIL